MKEKEKVYMADANYSAAGSSEITLKGAEDKHLEKRQEVFRGLTGSHLPLRFYVKGMLPFN